MMNVDEEELEKYLYGDEADDVKTHAANILAKPSKTPDTNTTVVAEQQEEGEQDDEDDYDDYEIVIDNKRY